jgi:hypothetical protein
MATVLAAGMLWSVLALANGWPEAPPFNFYFSPGGWRSF